LPGQRVAFFWREALCDLKDAHAQRIGSFISTTTPWRNATCVSNLTGNGRIFSTASGPSPFPRWAKPLVRICLMTGRFDGPRVRHWVDHNSVKVYNEQNVLRIETTINMPDMFRVYRRAQGQPHTARKKLRPLRKGVADIPLRAQDKSSGQQPDLRCQQDPRWYKLRRGGGRTSCLLASDLWSQPSVLRRLGHHQHRSAQDASRHTLGRCTNRETDLRPREPAPSPLAQSWPHPKGSQPSPLPPDRQGTAAHHRTQRHALGINRTAPGHGCLSSPLRLPLLCPKLRVWSAHIVSLRAR
jgi:hypothetical protein